MVSITLSVPEDVRKSMKKHDEINWSGFVRKAIEEKTSELNKFETLKKELQKDNEFSKWAVKAQRASRSGKLEKLKKKGLI
mgnify:CR=1 FL=1